MVVNTGLTVLTIATNCNIDRMSTLTFIKSSTEPMDFEPRGSMDEFVSG